MNAISLMHVDAVLLILASLCLGILICADRVFQPFLPAVIAAAIGGTAFLQAMWLLGVWIPGAAGYPWPRLSFDVAFFALVVWRTIVVLIECYRQHRRILDLQRQRTVRLKG